MTAFFGKGTFSLLCRAPLFPSKETDTQDDKLFSSSVLEGDEPLSPVMPFSMPVKTVIHDYNTDQKLLTVTEDKIHLCLQGNLKKIGRKRWIHPLTLLASLLLALATSEFDKLPWISSDLLTATFIVAAFVTAGWLIWELMHAGQMKQVPEVVENIFRDLRGEMPMEKEVV